MSTRMFDHYALGRIVGTMMRWRVSTDTDVRLALMGMHHDRTLGRDLTPSEALDRAMRDLGIAGPLLDFHRANVAAFVARYPGEPAPTVEPDALHAIDVHTAIRVALSAVNVWPIPLPPYETISDIALLEYNLDDEATPGALAFCLLAANAIVSCVLESSRAAAA